MGHNVQNNIVTSEAVVIGGPASLAQKRPQRLTDSCLRIQGHWQGKGRKSPAHFCITQHMYGVWH